jgi:hypothetical protein
MRTANHTADGITGQRAEHFRSPGRSRKYVDTLLREPNEHRTPPPAVTTIYCGSIT